MELTREKVKDWLSKTKNGDLFGPIVVGKLCTALLAKLDEPGVWDHAPEYAGRATVIFTKGGNDGTAIWSKIYTRELPKSRIDEISEEAVDKYHRGAVGAGSLADIIKSAILKYAEENK